MTLATYPHCTYIGDANVSAGTVYNILEVDYVGPDAISYNLGGSGTGSITDAENYLNTSLSTYAPWVFSAGEPPQVNYSQNQILFLTVDVDGSTDVIGFTQSGCIDLPIQSASTGTGTAEFYSQENLFDISVVEILLTGLMMIFLCMYLLSTKGVPWAK